MPRAQLKNNASASLVDALTAEATTFVLADASMFPAVTTGGNYFYATLTGSGAPEIIKVTDVTGVTLTCTRGQDGTVARSFLAGDQLSLRLTAVFVAELRSELDGKQPAGNYATLDVGSLVPTVEMATGTPDVTKFLRGDRVWATPSGAGGGGVGTLECYDAAGVRDDLPVLAVSAVDSLSVGSELVVGAACDIFQNTSGAFGWRDNLQPFVVKPSGATPPSYGVTIGNYEGYIWSATSLNQTMVDFHIDHDYAMGTVLYPHVHFRPLTALGGVVRWGFECSTSKGHGQQVGMGASVTTYVNFTVSAGQLGTHYVAEVAIGDAISALNVEPDSVIHVRVFRDAANAADTYAGTIWAWQADLHYQFGRLGTLNKAPNFYG